MTGRAVPTLTLVARPFRYRPELEPRNPIRQGQQAVSRSVPNIRRTTGDFIYKRCSMPWKDLYVTLNPSRGQYYSIAALYNNSVEYWRLCQKAVHTQKVPWLNCARSAELYTGRTELLNPDLLSRGISETLCIKQSYLDFCYLSKREVNRHKWTSACRTRQLLIHDRLKCP